MTVKLEIRAIAVFALFISTGTVAQTIPTDSAKSILDEARQVSDREHGRLWHRTLYGPTMIVDPATNYAVANQADAKGKLKPLDGVFSGTLPDTFMSANSAVDWEGQRWTILNWPLPDTSGAREKLLGHEFFHRIEPELGIELSSPDNAHLETLQGRYWLFLELRALQVALSSTGKARLSATKDALAFRAKRQRQFPDALISENALEMNEGLAEYTGVAAAAPDQPTAKWLALNDIIGLNSSQSVTRSFAYATGPAYGFLLDVYVPNWRDRIRQKGFVQQLVKAIKVDGTPLSEREKLYGGRWLFAAEMERAQEAEARKADIRHRFVDGPVLLLRLTDQMNYSFNPHDVVPFEKEGSYYGTLNLSDVWGTLTVENGALMSIPNKTVKVVAPAVAKGNHVEAAGWSLNLAAGWKVVAGRKPGDLEVVKE